MTETHECSQGATLATICQQLKGIEGSLEEMKGNQKEYLDEVKMLRAKINQADLDRAAYPKPEVVSVYLRKVDVHEVYFLLLGAAITIVIGVVSGALPRLLGWG